MDALFATQLLLEMFWVRGGAASWGRTPKALFGLRGGGGANRQFGVSPDGKRFLVIHPVSRGSRSE
jgi:hypothetical protein